MAKSMAPRPLARSLLAVGCAAALGAAAPALAGGAFETTSLVSRSSLTLSPMPAGLFGSMFAGGMNLGSWRDYTRQALLPDFSDQLGFRYEVDLGLLAEHEYLLLPGFVQNWPAPETSTRLTLDLSYEHAGEGGGVFGRTGVLDQDPGAFALDRTFLAPGVRREFSDGNSVDVSVVFANQRFASWWLGTQYAPANQANAANAFNTSSTGTGLQVGLSSELLDGISLAAAFRSHIEMDPFPAYRGVYSEPGDFDIPASANVGLVMQATERSFLSIEVERILYSEVNAFTTGSLPDAFLSLLGDGGSPEFGWRDHTVYSVGWNWRPSEKFDWRLSYRTGQQPTPTSEPLRRALESEIADSNVVLGFSRQTGPSTRVDFNASYSPSAYYLGPSLGRRPDPDDDQLEFGVRFIWDF